jgi:hypothetical protein
MINPTEKEFALIKSQSDNRQKWFWIELPTGHRVENENWRNNSTFDEDSAMYLANRINAAFRSRLRKELERLRERAAKCAEECGEGGIVASQIRALDIE